MGVAHRRHHRGGCDFYWPFCGTEPVRPGWSKYEGYRELGQPPYQGLSQKVRRATHQALPASPISSRQENQKSRCASRSEEHTSELQSRFDIVCRLLLEKNYNYSFIRI